MKAKVKANGKIIDVRIHGMNAATGRPISFYSMDGRDYYKAEELELDSDGYEHQIEENDLLRRLDDLYERVCRFSESQDAGSVWPDIRKYLDELRGILNKIKA